MPSRNAPKALSSGWSTTKSQSSELLSSAMKPERVVAVL